MANRYWIGERANWSDPTKWITPEYRKPTFWERVKMWFRKTFKVNK